MHASTIDTTVSALQQQALFDIDLGLNFITQRSHVAILNIPVTVIHTADIIGDMQLLVSSAELDRKSADY